MSKPKIVVFWGKPIGPIDSEEPHPYARIGKKKPVYDQLFVELAKTADVYIGIGYDNYPKPLYFSEAYQFLGVDKFVKISEGIEADAVYDRSARMDFPGDSELENKKVVNASKFKKFSNNKWELYKKFPQYCPKTFYAGDSEEYLKILSELDQRNTFVVKPYNGFKGKGIEFGNPKEFCGYPFERPVIIQEFKETSGGIPGLVEGRHDLRVAVVDGQIVWATIRQPKGNSLMANVAQGGTIREIKISEVPKSVLPIVDILSRDFKQNYFNPLFSIDFGFENGEPFIYEINDQIGFPLPEMKENTLIMSLCNLLLCKAKI